LFNRILLPLPSEYFPENAVQRAIDIASKFNSKLIIQYIFEEQVIDKIDNVSSGAVSQCALDEMSKNMKNLSVGGESTVIFEKIENIARKKNVEVKKLIGDGIHTDEILDCIKRENIDLMVTEFHKDTFLKYRILYDSPISIWLEQSGKEIEEVYGILTNLSPNKCVPSFAFKISQKLNIPLHFYYVLDDTEPYDENNEKHTRKKLISSLVKKGTGFKTHYKINEVTGDISSFVNHQFKKEDSGLVILGRFEKPVKIPFSKLDKKIEVSKKLKANVLILKGEYKKNNNNKIKTKQ